MQTLLANLETYQLTRWRPALEALVAQCQQSLLNPDGKTRHCREALSVAPPLQAEHLDLRGKAVEIGTAAALNEESGASLLASLQALMPWRKGPFSLFGIEIDSEWASWRKWERIAPSLSSLGRRRVLDIGSSNGYYLMRMAEEKPGLLLGLEPYMIFYHQFLLLQQYARIPHLFTLPVKFEQFPILNCYFDAVFCMGVFYHVRSPMDLLKRIHSQLRRDGELVLETLTIAGDGEMALFPRERYAKMNNVYFLPTHACLEAMLARCSFTEIRCVDVTPTTSVEQRQTEWIRTESLADFLDPADPSRTIEGYPAPVRSTFIARARK